ASIKPGAKAALYVSRAHAFAGILEATSGYYYDTARIWPDDLYPHRIRVACPLIRTNPTEWVRVETLLPELGFIRKPEHYGSYFRSSWLRIPAEDFRRIEAALKRQTVSNNPAERGASLATREQRRSRRGRGNGQGES